MGNKFAIDNNIKEGSDDIDYSNTNIAYISSNEKIVSYTGSKKAFLGNNTISNPEAIERNTLNLLDNQNSIFEESVVVIEINVDLKEYENKEIALILGEEDSYNKVIETKNKYTNIETVKEELDSIKEFWNNKIIYSFFYLVYCINI